MCRFARHHLAPEGNACRTADCRPATIKNFVIFPQLKTCLKPGQLNSNSPASLWATLIIETSTRFWSLLCRQKYRNGLLSFLLGHVINRIKYAGRFVLNLYRVVLEWCYAWCGWDAGMDLCISLCRWVSPAACTARWALRNEYSARSIVVNGYDGLYSLLLRGWYCLFIWEDFQLDLFLFTQ